MLLRKRKAREQTAASTLDLYYASDVHGSEQCWRKFLGAGRFYGVQALIMGGDLTGKAIVPITMDGPAFRVRFLGEDQSGTTREPSRLATLFAACTPGRRVPRRSLAPSRIRGSGRDCSSA